jgi:hypothetical protein
MSGMQTPVDWHAHAHQPGDMGAVLDSAAAAFTRVNQAPVGVLMLAQMPGQDVFAEFAERGAPGWTVQATEEAGSVVAMRGDARIVLVAGHQLLTAERLEILAYGARSRPREGLPADAMLRDLAERDVLAVLPWGVGKWLGSRGAIVGSLVQRLPPQALALGDNAARPRAVADARRVPRSRPPRHRRAAGHRHAAGCAARGRAVWQPGPACGQPHAPGAGAAARGGAPCRAGALWHARQPRHLPARPGDAAAAAPAEGLIA